MSDNSKKVSELPTAANVASSDRIMILRDPSGSPSVRTVNANILSSNQTILFATPANSSSNGIAGNICYDINYFYICIANNLWKRIPLNNF